MIALGPLIPSLAQQQKKLETEYSVYFLARALGFTARALSIDIDLQQIKKNPTGSKYLSKRCTYIMYFSFFASFGAGGFLWQLDTLFYYHERIRYSSKEHATFYNSLYWFSITFFRFAFLFLPGTIKQKIDWLVGGGIGVSFISLFFIQLDSELSLNFGSFAFGLCDSVLFPLLFQIITK